MTFLDYFYWNGLPSLTIFIVIHLRFIHERPARMIGATPSHVLTEISWLTDLFIGRHFNVLEHQYGRRDVMWKRFIRKSTPKNGNKQSSFQICFADKRRRKRTSYAISKPLRSTDIISIAQPFSDAIKVFFFPIQMLNGRNEVYFYMQFT